MGIPYGIFNAQAPVIADAQYLMKLDKWIVTERHVSAPSTPSPKQTALDASTWRSLRACSNTNDLSSPLLNRSDSSWSSISSDNEEAPVAQCGAVVSGAMGTYIRTH